MATTSHDPPPRTSEDLRKNGQIFAYFGAITFLYWIVVPHQGFVDIPITYLLKNKLHLDPVQVSTFRLETCVPVYLGCVFGFIRDKWNPLGLKDRGYFIIFGLATALMFIGLSFLPATYWSIFVGIFAAMILFRFVAAPYQGLIALIGQEDLMSGRLSTLWNVVYSIPVMAAYFITGFLNDVSPIFLFGGAAIILLLISAFGFWKPQAVFEGTYDKPRAQTGSIGHDLVRLFKHRAIYPAVFIMFLWNFAPGSNTPLQFYLTDKLHLSDAVYSNYYAIFAGAFIPTFFVYGFLCKRVSMRKLLIWGTVFAVPQMIPLAFIHSQAAALWLAAPIGLMGGVATVAYYDLAMRACPAGLQGTLMLAVDGGLILSGRIGDMLGSYIYKAGGEHGFVYCVIATTVVYALILPLIALVPRNLIESADGEPNRGLEEEIVAEPVA